jgi:hypothetical protein
VSTLTLEVLGLGQGLGGALHMEAESTGEMESEHTKEEGGGGQEIGSTIASSSSKLRSALLLQSRTKALAGGTHS